MSLYRYYRRRSDDGRLYLQCIRCLQVTDNLINHWKTKHPVQYKQYKQDQDTWRHRGSEY